MWEVICAKDLTLSWRGPLSYRNQSTDLQSKSMDWFLYDNGLRHERVKKDKHQHIFCQFFFHIWSLKKALNRCINSLRNITAESILSEVMENNEYFIVLNAINILPQVHGLFVLYLKFLAEGRAEIIDEMRNYKYNWID